MEFLIFSYPRCPKINTYIERYNKIIQDEFIGNNPDIIYDKQLFHKKLAEYLIFYNTERPHKSLGLKSPLEYLIENKGISQMYFTYTKILTEKRCKPHADRPKQFWGIDMTKFMVNALGWVYLGIVLDLYTKKIVGL